MDALIVQHTLGSDTYPRLLNYVLQKKENQTKILDAHILLSKRQVKVYILYQQLGNFSICKTGITTSHDS